MNDPQEESACDKVHEAKGCIILLVSVIHSGKNQYGKPSVGIEDSVGLGF